MDFSNTFPRRECTFFGVKDQRNADEFSAMRRFAVSACEELFRRFRKKPRNFAGFPSKLEFEYPVTILCTNLKIASPQGRMLLNIRCHGGAHQKNFDMAAAGSFVSDRELPIINRVKNCVEVVDNGINIYAIEHFFKPRYADLKSINVPEHLVRIEPGN